MGFPCGAEMDRIALENRDRTKWRWSGRGKRVFEKPYLGSIRVKDSFANLSGIETACQKAAAEFPPEEVIPELFFRISDAVVQMLLKAQEQTGLNEAVLVGGVSASRFLREELQRAMKDQNLRILFGDPVLSSDNAVGIARLGMRQYLSDCAKDTGKTGVLRGQPEGNSL